MSVFNLWGLCSCLRVFPWRKWLLCSSEKWNWVLCICEVHKHLSSPSTTTATMLSSSRWTFRKRSYKEHIAYATSVSRFSPFYWHPWHPPFYSWTHADLPICFTAFVNTQHLYSSVDGQHTFALTTAALTGHSAHIGIWKPACQTAQPTELGYKFPSC